MPNWGQGFQGAAGGAMAGGAYGGPVGALIGGGLGFVGGLFGDDGRSEYEEQLKQLAAGYGKRTAPQMGPAAQGSNSAFRQNQAGLIAQLQAMGRGQGPSAAQLQMQEAMDRAAGAQASAAAGAGGRGVNAGAALRQASNNTAAFNQQAARDTGMMRVNEQLGAINQLGQVIAQGRAADENMSQFNAGAQNQVSQANLQAALHTLGLNQQGELQALMAAMGAAPATGMGSQILAGGASAVPGLLQWGGGPTTQAPSGLPSDAQLRNQMGYGMTGSNGLITPMGW